MEHPVSGWDGGLSQDYSRPLGAWFADRLGARYQLTQTFLKEKTMFTLTDKVTAIRELLKDESAWIQQELALDAAGHGVDPIDSSACQFCLLGAIARVEGLQGADYVDIADSPSGELIAGVLRSRRPTPGEYGEDDYVPDNDDLIYTFNDDPESTTHSDVLSLLDAAAAKAGAAA